MLRITVLAILVLIVPLWNWNVTISDVEATATSLNRTFMELKRELRIFNLSLAACLNRTFMELKLIGSVLDADGVMVLIVPLWNWNSNPRNEALLKNLVLIVPLWNWNSARMQKSGTGPRLNRTFMELKRSNNSRSNTTTLSLNRTFMELKPFS